MSGMFGCWNLDERPLDVATFSSCLERISPTRAMPSASWHDGPVALGCKTNHQSSTASPPQICAGDVACVFDGRLDNRDELFSITRDQSRDPAAPDSDLVRAAYTASGDDFVEIGRAHV